ncbi:hypothetical protein STW0522RAO56_11600 [Raoultella planticola]|nr:hypothetical protein STW0522RAO56_11600 [Raoultella planticola]
MTSKLTRERLEKIKSWRETYGAGSNVMLPAEEAEELARMALAAMDSEPVAEVVSIYGDPEAFGEREIRPLVGIQQMPYGTKLYRQAQPAPERDQVRIAHAEWSQATFGNVGPVGPLKHLSKEALEAAAEPGDLSEWADMQFLLWDSQRRAGITDEQITQAMFDKLAVNKRRSWPEPKDGEPRLHIKEQPAPVVPDGYVMVPKEPTERMVIDGFESEPDETFSEPEVWEKYQKMSGCEQAAYRARLCWAAMIAVAPPAPNQEDI